MLKRLEPSKRLKKGTVPVLQHRVVPPLGKVLRL